MTRNAASGRIQVETYTSDIGVRIPRRFNIGRHFVEVAENLDRWDGVGYSYFKLKGDDGNIYVLRFDETSASWELTMFKSPRAESLAISLAERKPPLWRRKSSRHANKNVDEEPKWKH